MAKTTFLGLGVMGAPMAGYLAKAGHDVTVYNRTTSKAEAWTKANTGAFAATPREASAGADFVMICVGNDEDLRSVVLGDDGALASLSAGAIIVDHTTASADVARERPCGGHMHCAPPQYKTPGADNHPGSPLASAAKNPCHRGRWNPWQCQ